MIDFILIDFAKVEKTVERWNGGTVKRWLRGEKSNLCLICANQRETLIKEIINK